MVFRSASIIETHQQGLVRRALRDVTESLLRWRLWGMLGIRDVLIQYERAFIGPVWVILQAAAWIGAITFVFSGLLGNHETSYALYVALGVVLYNFITVSVTGGSEVFIRNRIIIHSHPLPFFSYVLRASVSSLFQLALQSITVIIVFIITVQPLTMTAFYAIPGLIIGIIMSVFIALVFGLAGTRFGDFRFATLAIMRLMLFITPVMWRPEDGGALKKWVAEVNPLAHFINLVRDPLMGKVPDMSSYVVALSWLAGFMIIGSVWFIRSRRTIPMWV